MGTGQKRNRVLVPQAAAAMHDFKYEIARELGVGKEIQGDYWGNVSSRDCGAVGGNMVRKMISFAESQLESNASAVTSQSLIGNSNSRNAAGNMSSSAYTGL
ncbi:MAG: small, acid-soluble spore protein, alpha/beta type, partial [Ignavibacteriales bacterium]